MTEVSASSDTTRPAPYNDLHRGSPMRSPVRVSFSPSARPFRLSVAQSGTVTVRVFPGWVVHLEPWWR